MYRNPRSRSGFATPEFFTSIKKMARQSFIFIVSLSTMAVGSSAQVQPSTSDASALPPDQAIAQNNSAITIPAGASIALVLTHPVQSRYIHRGDFIYAQITSPVNSGDQVAIPVGTFVEGKVNKLERKGGRAQLRLQSMSITFPDGYVAAISGPVTLESSDGYTLKDPGSGRVATIFLLPAAGAGVGALVGYAAADKQASTMTTTLPPGCTGPPPGCLTSSMSVPAHPGMSVAEGAGVGIAAGGIASIFLLTGTHNFFIDVGTPVEMTLQQPVTLPQDQVAKAVQESAQHPAPTQPIVGLPQAPPVTSANQGTCYTPGTPGTPPTVIPGAPGPDGVPGPPTVIPGTPPTPGTPYPCP